MIFIRTYLVNFHLHYAKTKALCSFHGSPETQVIPPVTVPNVCTSPCRGKLWPDFVFLNAAWRRRCVRSFRTRTHWKGPRWTHWTSWRHTRYNKLRNERSHLLSHHRAAFCSIIIMELQVLFFTTSSTQHVILSGALYEGGPFHFFVTSGHASLIRSLCISG